MLFDDGSKVDLMNDDNLPFNLTYALLDLQFLDKRSGAFSNIFKVPASGNNNRKFKHYYSSLVTNPQSFSFLDHRGLKVNSNGTQIFDGLVRGVSAYKNQNPKQYDIQLLGNNLKWADALSNMNLNSLTYPTVDYDADTVRDSWTNTYVDGYVAPLACYGKPAEWYMINDSTANLGNGELFFQNGPGGGAYDYQKYILRWKYTDFRYWIFIRPLLEEMYKNAGYKLVSNFITGAEFSKFILYINDKEAYDADDEGNYPASINIGTDQINDERKCIDLLKGIQNRFNLFFATDDNTKTVYCEPFDEFMDLYGPPNDWTGKIDYKKQQRIIQFTDLSDNILLKAKQDAVSESLEKVTDPFGYLLPAEFYNGGFIFPQTYKKKEYENAFFEDYMMGNVNCAHYRYQVLPNYGPMGEKDLYPVFGNFAQNVCNGLSILMPCIWSDAWDEFPDMLLSGSTALDSVFRNAKSIPEKSGKTEPKFAYYAGMTFIESMMGSTRFHSGINGFKFPIQDLVFPIKTPDDWHNIFLFENDAFRDERPFAFICDAHMEESSTEPKNYYFGTQSIWVYAGATHYPMAPWDLQYVFSTYPDYKLKGLFEKHYMRLAKSIQFGKRLATFMNIKETDLLKLDFRKKYSVEFMEAVLLQISKFEPLNSDSTECLFLELLSPVEDDLQYLLNSPLHVIYTHMIYS